MFDGRSFKIHSTIFLNHKPSNTNLYKHNQFFFSGCRSCSGSLHSSSFRAHCASSFSWNHIRRTSLGCGDITGFKASVLTNSKIHYRATDCGQTWCSFEVPVPPALVARLMSFHSYSKKWGSILYQGTSCNCQWWNTVRHDKVCVMLTLFDL
jgi:hypothetical protein